VRELLTVGRGSLIGMGAVILHDVQPNSVMAGNPARRLRARAGNHLPSRTLRFTKRAARWAMAAVSRVRRAVRG
jgi:serine acetyltransferase